MIRYFLFIFTLMVPSLAMSQTEEKMFTHSDPLRGSVNSEREWWDVLRYDITVQPTSDSTVLKVSTCRWPWMVPLKTSESFRQKNGSK